MSITNATFSTNAGVKIFGIGLVLAALFIFPSESAYAQTESPLSGVSEVQIDAALADLSELYGHPVERVDQARAICNLEEFLTDCAEIGKEHNLFSQERARQVDVVLSEFTERIIEDLKSCTDEACLVDVASTLASRLASRAPAIAQSLELIPQKVEEKRIIVETAKEIGVSVEQCHTMDSDTAPVELLRACARLAKDQRIQQYIPEQTKQIAASLDGSLLLKESLAKGEYQCGSGTLESCGDYCLNPTQTGGEQSVSAIPPACRQIAERFFGPEGVRHLEDAYTKVQQTSQLYGKRAELIVFTALDGRRLTDPIEIGRYLEEQGSRGNVEAVEKGMDFLAFKGFVKPQDGEFALSMVKKVREQGGVVDFDRCRINPQECEKFVPDEHREEFATMQKVETIMRSAMASRGVADLSLCDTNPQLREACVEGTRSALSQIGVLAQGSSVARGIVGEIQNRINFSEKSFEARKQVEEKLKTGEQLSFGDQTFRDFRQIEEFCGQNAQLCLAETAKQGFISKDFASEKYERYFETQQSPYPQFQPPGQGGVAPGQTIYSSNFNKEEALKQFQVWLENPQGPPPIPTFHTPGQPTGVFPSQIQFPGTPYPAVCSQIYQRSCAAGEYRQESRDRYGCSSLSECIPLTTPTQPVPKDNRFVCPALPTIDFCPAGQEKVVSFSSPECGTYYSCAFAPQPQPRPSIVFPYTFSIGKTVYSWEEAKAYCYANGPGSGQGIAAECEAKFGILYGIQPPLPISVPPFADCTKYGSGWHSMDSSGNCFNPDMTEYRTLEGAIYPCAAKPVYGCTSGSPIPTGQKEQIWNSLGLRSWIKADADPTRTASLKQSCVNTPSNANIWMPGSGDYASSDFGMPDAEKCRKAAACTSEQYFDGATCVSRTSTICPSGQYWSGNACVFSGTPQCSDGKDNDGDGKIDFPSDPECYDYADDTESTSDGSNKGDANSCPGFAYSEWDDKGVRYCRLNYERRCDYNYPSYLTNGTNYKTENCPANNTTVTGSCSSELIGLLGSGCHNMGNAWFDGPMAKYVLPGTAAVKECSSASISGCSSSSPGTTCPSGQYWSGSSCVTSPTSPPPSTSGCPSGYHYMGDSSGGYCMQDSSPSTCQPLGGGSTYTCPGNTTSTTCASGQYWDGSSCVSSGSGSAACGNYVCESQETSTSCPADCGSYTPSPPPSSGSTCSSDQYWDGTACVSSSSPTPPPSSTPDPATACAQSGGSWDGSSCQFPTPPPPPPSSYFCPSKHAWNGSFCSFIAQETSSRYGAGVLGAFKPIANLFQSLFGQ